MLFAISVLLLEILLRLTTGNSNVFSGEFILAFLPVFFLFELISLLLSRLKNVKLGNIIQTVLLEVITIWFILSFFTYDTYKFFMPLSIITREAGNVATVFGDRVLAVITKGIGIILLYHIPIAAYIIFRKFFRKLPFGWLTAATLILFAISMFSSLQLYMKMGSNSYDADVRKHGLMPSLSRSFVRTGASPQFEIDEEAVSTPVPEEMREDAEDEKHVEYGYNVMDIDFDELEERSHDNRIDELNEYVRHQTPSRKNEYTGIFEGKNLILITAEAFTKEVIDKGRTPTLYRLANKGIVFEDFYQPAWGGSTSTGEYSFVTGLVPVEPTSIQSVIYNNMYFTMGNQLQRQNYTSIAYHNGQYDYYERNNTHTHLGYDSFIAYGSGLVGRENGGNALSSDLGLMIATTPDYIDSQPFSIYYMTISGHCVYTFYEEANRMAAKNQAVTEDMPYSMPVKAYYSCNLELEYALSYLVETLEEKGIADDTVIALVSDHYPYGLTSSFAWDNTTDYLSELYGYNVDSNPKRDHNAAIIWCGSLEDDDPIIVSEPVSSLDMLPTLSNLFGLEYDSRMLVGRDVFSDTEPLVMWNDFSWLTDKGYYDNYQFYPTHGEQVDKAYINRISTLVRNKWNFSDQVAETNYYTFVFGKDDIQ